MSIINNHLSIIRGEVLFLNAMKKQNTVFIFYFVPLPLRAFAPLPSVNLGSIYLSNPFNQRNQRLKTQSIKNNKLCKTKPISEKPKMNLNPCSTMTNNKKQRTFNYSKQTQSNPTCPERSRRVCGELASPELACGELVEPVEGGRTNFTRHYFWWAKPTFRFFYSELVEPILIIGQSTIADYND